MYADREEADNKLSAKDRLNGSFSYDSDRRRQIAGKRQRQDDKWEHDLYEDDPQVSSRKVDARDLRLKLQRKVFKNSGTRSFSGVRDLREKLSGTMNPQPMNTDPPKPKVEAAKPARRSIAVGTPAAESTKVANPAPRKKASQKAGPSVDEFLTSLDLEKYSITFQAEEVDMTALVHMTDEDLKALGIPMGPRKKILLALESRV
ncbi:ankyrin repeat and SAM domain-containing protein 6-like [Pyrus ussuriensis x Pyrus communis]|uniref:Ankyrin repeat and SAM domain-containing protein 6-like n=1 Tax=Pyrus ussuriensis x Pyrus communis TaxID=2448454 RepID=A0A5N5FG93_9ROSA|nr:ankyrin repeat and SAM domain-containing protein 6-like [Pyrus ussuriensis x Pyrus communis]